MFGLKGHRVLITASSRGIGLGVARVLVSEGAKVVINGRSRERLERAVEELRRIGAGEVYGVVADITVREEAERLVDEAAQLLGGLDSLVYVTGPPRPGLFEELGLEDWDYATRLLIMSAIWVTRKVIPLLKKSSNPSIVYLTSVAVKEPIEGLALSNTLRVAIQGLAKTLSRELAGYGIRVNTVLPGYVMTERVREVIADRARREARRPEEVMEEVKASIPLGRLAEPEEIGYLVAFLISRYASYITGAAIPIDGGLLHSTL